VLWKRYGSQQKYESASKHPVIHIFVEFHNVLYCELEDFFVLWNHYGSQQKYESASKHQ
jgi:hypothetical protein